MCMVTEYSDVHCLIVWNIKRLETTCWLIRCDASGVWNPKQLLEKEDARATCPVKEQSLSYIVRWTKARNKGLYRILSFVLKKKHTIQLYACIFIDCFWKVSEET